MLKHEQQLQIPYIQRNETSHQILKTRKCMAYSVSVIITIIISIIRSYR